MSHSGISGWKEIAGDQRQRIETRRQPERRSNIDEEGWANKVQQRNEKHSKKRSPGKIPTPQIMEDKSLPEKSKRTSGEKEIKMPIFRNNKQQAAHQFKNSKRIVFLYHIGENFLGKTFF